MKNTLLFLFVFILSPFFLDASGGWQVGVAKTVITPKQPMWMAGYAARTKPAVGKLHDLWAKALFVEDNSGHSALLITSDLVYFTTNVSEQIRNEIQKKTGLTKAQIILNSSHTHSGPELIGNDFRYTYSMHADLVNQTGGKYVKMSEGYSHWLIRQIVKLAESAKRSKRPANIYSGNGIVRFQVNRRNNKEAELTNSTELKGPNDYSVPVLKVEDKRGHIKAIVFGYACHATVLDGYQWSGDYPGFAQLELENRYKGATAMFFQGAGGDQNPLPRRTVPLAKQYGMELASAVERILGEDMQPLSPKLKTAYSEVVLNFAKSDLTAEEQLSNVIKKPEYPDYLKRNAKLVLDKLKAGVDINTSAYPYPVQAWGMGEQLIIALGGELTIGYAIRLKQILGENIFVLGYCNDAMGYIPTVKILEEGGYEGTGPPIFPMLWASDIEEVIVNEVARIVPGLSSGHR